MTTDAGAILNESLIENGPGGLLTAKMSDKMSKVSAGTNNKANIHGDMIPKCASGGATSRSKESLTSLHDGQERREYLDSGGPLAGQDTNDPVSAFVREIEVDSYLVNESEEFLVRDDITESSWEFTIASSQQQAPRFSRPANPNARPWMNPNTHGLGGTGFNVASKPWHPNAHFRPHPHQHPPRSERCDNESHHKLEFMKLRGRLYGRDRECRQLRQAWEDILASWKQSMAQSDVQNSTLPRASSTEATRRRFIAISGEAGTGKSSLAETLKLTVTSSGGFFLMGKFPQQHRLSRQTIEPYAAFESACNELCEMVVSLYTTTPPTVSEEATKSHSTSSGDEGPETFVTTFKPLQVTFAQFRERLEEELGADASILTRIIPGLLQLFHADSNGKWNGTVGTATASESESIGYLEAQHQFKYAFRRFVRAVTSFGPMVLVLDDLQWADSASMELLEALVTDRESSSVLIIGCYRDDEDYATMPHIKTLDNMRSLDATASTGAVASSTASSATATAPSNQDGSLQVDFIPICNLEVTQVHELLIDLLSLSESKTLGLAECVHKKTLGNVFFVIQFVTLLQDTNLLVFDAEIHRWTYDLNAIQASTAATENVVTLMTNRMKRLPESIGRVLPMMACLGSTFSVPLFEVAMVYYPQTSAFVEDSNPSDAGNQRRPSSLRQTALQCLSHCEVEGLIESSSFEVKSYQWVHDKIQEAAFALISDNELATLKLEIGKVLLEQLDAPELEQNLIIVVNLLTTEGPMDDLSSWAHQHPIEVAQLCLRAGMKTIENAAFEQAAGYLAAGISRLPPDCWETHYDLSLELFSTASEAEFCVGNFERTRSYCNSVLAQEHRPLLDKRRVYNVLIDCMAAEQSMAAAFFYCKSILAKLGCRFPKRGIRLHVLAGILRVKATLRKYSDTEAVLQLPMLQDDKQQWKMALLDKFTTHAYMTSPDMLPLVILKGLHITHSYGVSDYSPPMFAFLGFLLAAFFRDYKGGQAFVNQALELLKKLRHSRKVESRVLFLSHALVSHWMHPISLLMQPLLTSYEVGMAMGDTENACWGIYFYLEYSFLTGASLKLMLEDLLFYSNVMTEVKQRTTIWHILLNLWQAILHLTGANPFNGTLSGDVMDQAEALRTVSDEDYKCRHAAIYRMQMYVAFYLGKYDLVYQSIRETNMDKGSLERTLPGISGICHLYAFNGLSMVSLYRQTNEKKYLNMSKKFAATLKYWVSNGNPNVTHFDALMDAEMESLRGHNYAAASRFEMAELYAGSCGLTQDRALAHERYGEHLARLGPEHAQNAKEQLGEALKLYEEWGAHAKVQQLRMLHHDVLGSSSSEEVQIDLLFSAAR